MKLLIFSVFLMWTEVVLGQGELFNNQIQLKDGVYTSIPEILANKPKYYDCLFESKIDFWFGEMSIYYSDKLGSKYELTDTILLVVDEGKRYVRYENGFYKLILTGAISTFYIETIYASSTGYNRVSDQLFFWDFQTGTKQRLNNKYIDEIMERDSVIYKSYSALSNSKQEKTLYSYILKYNLRHPIYIKKEEETPTPPETEISVLDNEEMRSYSKN